MNHPDSWERDFAREPTEWELPVAERDTEVQPIFEEVQEMLDRLRAEGYRVRATCLVVPVQLEGFLPTGEAFYLRCRYDTCRLTIAPPDGDPIQHPAWEGSVSGWDEHEAGFLDATETETILQELVDRYHAEARTP